MKNKIALIYRSSKSNRFSIETLFSPLDSYKQIERIELEVEFNSVINFFKILFFSLKIKQKIIHITGDVHYMAIFLFWKRIIITVHDLNHYEDLKGLKKLIYGIVWFRIPLLISKRIIVISPHTRCQILKHFNVNENKIKIIPNSFLKFESSNSTVIKNNLSFQILFIGSDENKNLKRLIYAIEGLDNIFLKLIGKQPFEICKLLDIKKINYSISYNLSRKELEVEYQKSNLLYFASLKEGFGLPILEAQSIGVPVITSNTTSMPFVAGDGALIINPYCIKSIKNAILAIQYQKIDLKSLVQKGIANTNRFSQDLFLKSYFRIYEELKSF